MQCMISSYEACSKCKNHDQCINIAMNKPELVVRCIHFGYIKQMVDDTIKTIQIQMNEYIREEMNRLFGQKEN